MNSSVKKQIKPLLLIPAAGYGRRVGSPPIKELLPHPVTKEPLFNKISYYKNKYQLPVHVITRKEKLALIDLAKHEEMSVQVIEPSLEWSDTLRQSEPNWHEDNILVLPDVEFSPESALIEITKQLVNHDIVFATFDVEKMQSWGCLRQINGKWQIAEKPKEPDSGLAWGLIGFKKHVGLKLWQSILQSHLESKWQDLPQASIGFVRLDSFVDLTRSQDSLKGQ